MPDIKAKINNLPSEPGVYQFKNSSGKVIYIGKAKSLKKRVKQYFQAPQPQPRLTALVSKISDIEYITTDNETEALLLEYNLIKEIKPRYNINLKDDKSYPYIIITNELFPRVFPTRNKKNDSSKYFGPYTDVKTMRNALKIIRNIFMIRTCNYNLTEETIAQRKYKLCLEYHIKKCEGSCEGLVNADDYREMIDEVEKLLNGKTSTLLKDLNEKMKHYSENTKYEKAAQTRDKINAIKTYFSRQKVINQQNKDIDVLGYVSEGNDGCCAILKIRDGRAIGKTHKYINNIKDKDTSEILENIITDYYFKTDFIPEEIYVQTKLKYGISIRNWLESRKKSKVLFITPQKGEKAKLVEMVKKNAKLLLNDLKLTKLKKQFITPSLESLKTDLKLSKLPRRIECFDISHTQGIDTVASMITFLDGKPRKTEYRRYKLKRVLDETGHPDDFLSVREVIHRRFKRIIEEKKTPPDLIIIDGGKGQLSSAVKVITDMGFKIQKQKETTEEERAITVIGIAKRLDDIYFPYESDPHPISKSSGGLKLLQKIRNEAHRFAVEYHRNLRKRRLTYSELQEINGIGEKSIKKLLKKYGSVNEIKKILETGRNELETFIGKKLTEKIAEYYGPK